MNYASSEKELIQLRSLLVEPKVQLTEMKFEVNRLQSLLESTKKYVDVHSASISPIRHLPPELLAEIFVHCLPEKRYAPRYLLAQAPLLLTTITREWRQIAISTPALWKSLHICIPSQLTSQAFKRRAIGSALWLDRSRSVPISISLWVLNIWGRQMDVHVNRRNSDMLTFMETLLNYSSHIKEFSFVGPMTDIVLLDTLTKLINLPILDTFCIQGTEPGLTHEFPFPFTQETEFCLNHVLPFTSFFQHMPVLKKLSITGFFEDRGHYNPIELDWGNLTELTIQPMTRTGLGLSPAEIRSILRCTGRLRTLTVTLFKVFNQDGVPGGDVINLPKMREIHLEIIHHTSNDVPGQTTVLPSFFYSFCCPSLKELSVQSSWVHNLHEVFTSALPSPQGLEKLSVNMPMTTNSLFECLSLVPNLRLLEIGDGVFHTTDSGLSSHIVNDSVLMCLISNSTDDSYIHICPHLQHIHVIVTNYAAFKYSWAVRFDRTPGITYNALLTFLESRVHTLESCDIFFAEPRADESTPRLASEPTTDDLRRLEVMRDSGLKIKIRYAKILPATSLDMEGKLGTGIMI